MLIWIRFNNCHQRNWMNAVGLGINDSYIALSGLTEKCLIGLAIIGGFILLVPIAKQASSQNTCISHHAQTSSDSIKAIHSSRIMGSVRYCAGGS